MPEASARPARTTRAAPLPPDERRAAILAVARPLLLEQGARFTTRQVAEAAGIAEGTLFRVFPTKRDLFDAVVEQLMDPREICADLDAISLELPLEERIAAALARIQRGVDEVSAVFAVMMQQDEGPRMKESHHDEAARARHQEQSERLHASVLRLLVPDAEELAASPDEAASLLRAMAFSTAHPHISDHHVTDPHRLAQLLVHGLVS
ncbi:helix-turn-helix domain-containing protein [Luteococcus peritonei]|uniref:TetR/AcrR family transcriptional regulator n=1 Tax=Luteococcus peritonei TaxID=88874 RepID=A0ABW4RYA1_9ACTN